MESDVFGTLDLLVFKIQNCPSFARYAAGYFAACYTMKYPQHVEKLILASPVGMMGSLMEFMSEWKVLLLYCPEDPAEHVRGFPVVHLSRILESFWDFEWKTVALDTCAAVECPVVK